jgi:CMP-N-acetylneuraminic acid synthetase
MSTLAVIPARLNSRRCPGKVVRRIGAYDWPMLWYTIKAAHEATTVDQILVVTDSDEVEGCAYGCPRPAHWPWGVTTLNVVREPEGGSGNAVSATAWAASNHGATEDVAMLLPTSPLRGAEHVNAAIMLYESLRFITERAQSVVSVTSQSPQHNLVLCGDGVQWQRGVGLRSNGAIQITSLHALIATQKFVHGITVPYFMDPVSGIDVDTEDDFKRAAVALAARGEQ